jgi:hypothetical protein
MVEMVFKIEGSSLYRGYTDGRTWNRWECPSFTFEVASQIAEDFREDGATVVYDEARDCFVFKTNEYPDEEDELFEPRVVDGEKLYPIGAGLWCWESEARGTRSTSTSTARN